jgi:hypothetical protein
MRQWNMKPTTLTLLGGLFLAMLFLPPWRVEWHATSTGAATGALPDTWAGFHPWSYAGERPSRVIAFDGEGVGGRVGYAGTPRVAIGVWGGLLAFAAAAFLLAAVGERPGSADSTRSPPLRPPVRHVA